MTFRFTAAKRIYPIKPPDTVEFSELLLEEVSTEAVAFDPLETPVQRSLPTIERPRVSPSIVGKSKGSVLYIPTPRSFGPALLAPPPLVGDGGFTELLPSESVSLFEPLPVPRVVGRTFREVGSGSEARRGARGDSSTKCPHGAARSQCATCTRGRRKASPKQGQQEPGAEDALGRLRFIFQPPVLPHNGRPAIFPNGLKPYPFQIAGVTWLVENPAALLADQMGMGKTVQAIIAMRVLFRRGALRRTLVVCPASMANVWEREVRSWAPELRPLRVWGDARVRPAKWKSPAEIYIVSYETLARDIGALPGDRFDLYVLDEAQKVKNHNTKNHRAVRQLQADYRWALTGTPIENSAIDVATLFDVLRPKLFSRRDPFWHKSENVRRRIDPYLLRRTIEDVGLDLPEVTRQDHWLDLLPKQRSAYDKLEFNGISDIRRQGDSATRFDVLGLINQLKQACNVDIASGQSCKLDFLRDELEVLTSAGDKALVFSQYPNKTLKVIEPGLGKFRPTIFDGSLSNSRRDTVVDDFQHAEDSDVLLMSVRSGGVGLTLSRANHVFHFDHWWNPAVIDQASARVHRIGQTKPVFIHSLYAVDTIEERIFNLLEEKRAIFEEVFSEEINDKELERLSDKDLFGLFGLAAPGQDTPAAPRKHMPAARRSTSLQTDTEKDVRMLFEHLGYVLSVGKRVGDGSTEIDMYRPGRGGTRALVRCYSHGSETGLSEVRALFETVSGNRAVSQGILVTDGTFTQRARAFAKSRRITLIDGAELKANVPNIRRRRTPGVSL